MSYPPVFNVCGNNDAVAQALGGVGSIRLFPFDRAPKAETRTYAVWQVVAGEPGNYLGGLPDLDQYTLQFDVYAATANDARLAAEALRDAIEPVAYVTVWDGESRDPKTGSFLVTFLVDWFVSRA
jgi:hypothetical protein